MHTDDGRAHHLLCVLTHYDKQTLGLEATLARLCTTCDFSLARLENTTILLSSEG